MRFSNFSANLIIVAFQHATIYCTYMDLKSCRYRMKRANRSRMGKAKQKAWFRFMFITIRTTRTRNKIWSTMFILTYLCISVVRPKIVTFFSTSRFGFNFPKIFCLFNFWFGLLCDVGHTQETSRLPRKSRNNLL